MKNDHSVSVIITTKNRLDYLIRAIESVVAQSLIPDEVIIIDDNSKSLERIKEKDLEKYKKDIHFRVKYNSESKGGNFCRNLGASLSTGSILMFLDDDDLWLPDKIREQIETFKKHINSNIGLVYTGKQFVSSTNLSVILRKSAHTGKKCIWHGNFPGSTSGVAVTKKIFDDVGGFDEQLKSLQDYELWIRIIRHSQAVWDEKYNLVYTVHNSIGSQISADTSKHISSVNYLKSKYELEISKLNFWTKRYFLSRMEHVIARSYRRNNDIKFLKYYLRSLFYYPTIRTFVLPFHYK